MLTQLPLISELMGSHDPPASAFLVAETTGLCQQAHLKTHCFYASGLMVYCFPKWFHFPSKIIIQYF